MNNEMEDFDVVIANDESEEKPVIITTSQMGKQWLEQAMRNYDPKNRTFSAYLNDKEQASEITYETLDNLANNPQNDLRKILTINAIVRKYINKDDIIGKVVETIESNINTSTTLSYKDFPNDSNKLKDLEEIKKIIDDFNDQINLKKLIKNAIPTTYTEGTYIVYCRQDGRYIKNWFPLGVVEITDYDINDEPAVLINMKELKSCLQKTIKRTRKNKALFFEKLEQEIKSNYPNEVYQAYKSGESYAKLDYKWVGVMRINNQNRRYGLTPIFRALFPTLMLEQFSKADKTNSAAQSKKIIVQLLNDKLLGDTGNRQHFEEMTYAHQNLVSAFAQKTVLVTPPAYVSDIKYVESEVSLTDTKTVNNYRERVLSTLGIGFLMSSSSTGASVASIALNQLLKTINSISEQLEWILEKWYRNIVIDAGYDVALAPTIKIIDSELLEQSLKQDLAKMLYTLFNCSLETSLDILGIDIEDEKAKREHENEIGLDKTFSPRCTAYTSSGQGKILDNDGDSKSGRPTDNNVETTDKRQYDKNYNEVAR